MKKILAFVLAAMMLIGAFAGCSSTKKENAASGWVNSYFSTLPTTLNAFVNSSTEGGEVLDATSMYLYRQYLNDDGSAYVGTPEFASELPIQMDEEGKVWRVKLRENCKFADGTPMNADTVIFSYQMLLDPEQVNPKATIVINSIMLPISGSGSYFDGDSDWDEVGIKKIDEYTIDFYSDIATTQFNARRGLSFCPMIHEATYLKTLSDDKSLTLYGTSLENYVSAGPFILKEWIADSKVVLERNPNFIHADKIKLEGITYVGIPDAQTAVELFIKGEIDMVTLSYDHWASYAEDPRVHNYYDDSLMYMFINMGNPTQNNLLGKLNFRNALYYGIDRVKITNAVGGEPTTRYIRKAVVGNLETGERFIDMPGSTDYIDDPTTVYDPVKANEYFSKALEECNLTSATLDLMYSEVAIRTRAIFEMLQVDFQSVFNNKLTVTLRPVPANQTQTLRRWNPDNPTSFEATLGSLLPSADDPSASFGFFISNYSPPRFCYGNPEFDELYARSCSLEANQNNDLKIELCQKMEQIVLRDKIIVPVYETETKMLLADHVQLPTKDSAYLPGFGFGYPLFASTK